MQCLFYMRRGWRKTTILKKNYARTILVKNVDRRKKNDVTGDFKSERSF